MLVLLDNASSEFTFLVRFFAPTRPLPSGDADINVATSSFTPRSGNQSTENLFSSPPPVGGPLRRLSRKDSAMSALSLSAASVAAATGGRDDLLRPADSMSQVGEDDDDDDYHRGSINGSVTNRDGVRRGTGGKVSLLSSEALKELEGVWRQVMETAVEYCQVNRTCERSCYIGWLDSPLILLLWTGATRYPPRTSGTTSHTLAHGHNSSQRPPLTRNRRTRMFAT